MISNYYLFNCCTITICKIQKSLLFQKVNRALLFLCGGLRVDHCIQVNFAQ